MTPREFQREIDAAVLRQKDDSEARMVQAWQTAAFWSQAQAGKLVDIRTLLSSNGRSRTGQTRDEQRHALEVLSAQYKIPLKTVVH